MELLVTQFFLVGILTDVRVKLEQGWTQGCRARDRCGRPVAPTRVAAHSFCLSGALENVIARYAKSPAIAFALYLRLAEELRHHTGPVSLAIFNDARTTSLPKVLDVVTRTMEDLGKEPRQREPGTGDAGPSDRGNDAETQDDAIRLELPNDAERA